MSAICLKLDQSKVLLSGNGLKNIAGKGENAGHQHFPLFSQCFLPFWKTNFNFQSHLFCPLQMLWVWTSLKFCRFVKSKVRLTWKRLNSLVFTKHQVFSLTGISCRWQVNYDSHEYIFPLPGDKFLTLPNWKSLQTTISNLTKMAESYPNG